MNWFQPLIWSQIETAAKNAGRPWRATEIAREAKKLNPMTFDTLTSQVVGRWIDKALRDRGGPSRWLSSVLEEVKKGNSPGGQNTRKGILVRI